MKKTTIDIEDLLSVLSDMEAEGKIKPSLTKDILKEAEKLAAEAEKLKEEEKAEKGKRPPTLIAVVCSEEQMELPVKDATFWVVKTTEEIDHNQLPGIIQQGAYNFNSTDRKAKKHPIKNLPDAMRTLKKKHYLGYVTPEGNIPKHLTKEPCITVAVPFNLNITK